MNSLQTGDEVRVFVHNRYRPAPEGGWVASVTKVARKYATATYTVMDHDWRGETRSTERTVEFDMATGTERGGSSHSGYYVRTPEQLELEARQGAATDLLRERGIELRTAYGHRFTLEQLEALAEVVKTWEE